MFGKPSGRPAGKVPALTLPLCHSVSVATSARASSVVDADSEVVVSGAVAGSAGVAQADTLSVSPLARAMLNKTVGRRRVFTGHPSGVGDVSEGTGPS